MAARRTTITVHNNRDLTIICQKRDEGFELRLTGPIKSKPTLIDHHLTHDDLESRLCYSRKGDLKWEDTPLSEIPRQRHRHAVEMEETLSRTKFVDFDRIVLHLSTMGFLSSDPKEVLQKRKTLLGPWTDGIATITFEPGSALKLVMPKGADHILNGGRRIHGHPPNSWRFANWRLYLFNREHRCGQWLSVINANDRELHFVNTLGPPNQIALTMRRA